MPQTSRQTTFYAVLAAGIAFIVIGIASVFYNNTPVDVPLTGNTADIVVRGSMFNVIIMDPSKQLIKSVDAISNFNFSFTAKREGVHRIEIRNIGTSELTVGGHAKTKGSAIAFSGQMMLIITGIVVTGFSLRLIRR
jgi:hypothetical protein